MKLYIKYMVSLRCKLVVKEELKRLGLHEVAVDLGVVEISEDITDQQRLELRERLLKTGLELLDDTKTLLIERIKNVIIELIHYSDGQLTVNNYPEYLGEKLQCDYTYLSTIFSEIKGITIQQFVILHKIERVKELLLYDKLNLTEISYRLNYSSVAHLSNQFKSVTGLTPSYFKKMEKARSSNLEKANLYPARPEKKQK
ncbi:helix-turn-helix domain-containing protein [Parachryseolinea silvisoli]|jgi:AraC-like DNA-binding protein|uniref:helix-turn-helix domain-containing protein n=1 Tax=Parachryseolinea silvisoli TaxID=2873601 RepID=UPI002265C00A|nr:AraC family transcriptional regulator [Parachryseolinea silvisoli]MCD9019224.1 AraC family transcriptional regulator [Parachryseolinea silvisoli]